MTRDKLHEFLSDIFDIDASDKDLDELIDDIGAILKTREDNNG